MKPGRWPEIEALLDEAFERPAGERGAFLDRACAGDPELRAAVEALLAADEAAGDFLITPAPAAAAALLAETAADVTRELGPYRLVREIGSGGMGVVYEAEDTRLRRRVAIKLLPPECSRDPAAKERFLREARAASALDDPNICTVHDIGECDGQLYIVMAFYEGETLKERLARGPLPVAEARQVAVQVTQALMRAHETGIVHRDIKPANVMLTRRCEVKVLDFGIAKIKGDATLTRAGNSPGTPAYMSPEHARGGPVDGRSDLWAVGVLLYEMLAGRRPFPGEDGRAVLAMIQGRDPEPLDRLRPEVPAALARTVARALAKEPARRHQSAEELLQELEKVPRAPAMPKSLRRAGLLAGGLAAALLLALFLPKVFRTPPPPLRVAVLRPALSIEGNNPDLAYVASDVVEATMAALISLEGLQPIDPPQSDETSGSEAEKLRRAEANEVIAPIIRCQGDECRVMLRRLREPGDVLLKTLEPFEIQAGIENVQRLSEGVAANLRKLYPDRPPRPNAPGDRVRPEDYSAYVQLQRRVDDGERLKAEDLDRLDALLRTSPDLLSAYVLAAEVARDLEKIDRAFDYVSRAEALTPDDPRVLFTRFHAEVDAQRFAAAQGTVARLSKLIPGDARVSRAEADLLQAQGNLKEALRVLQRVAERRPLWRPILALATLEYRLGESDSARGRLEKLLDAQPSNQHVRQNLAVLEALYGDLARAAEIYEELIRFQPARGYFSNLGFIRFLLGEFAAAESADRQALKLDPGQTLTRFNLAVVLEAQGKSPEARRLFVTLVDELAATPRPGDDRTRMQYAQCLLHLGLKDDAARLAEEVLGQVPQEVLVLHDAARFYALLGKRLKALYYTELALGKGMRREWFTIPEFNSLQNDRDFQSLLDSHRPARPPSADDHPEQTVRRAASSAH